MEDSTGSAGAGLAGGIVVFFLILAAAAYFLYCLPLVKVFNKAGKNPVYAWIPFANAWIFFNIGDVPGILSIIPFANLIGMIMTIINVNKKFGQLGGMAVVGILFPWLWLFMLAFGKANWQGDGALHASFSPVAGQQYGQQTYQQGQYVPQQYGQGQLAQPQEAFGQANRDIDHSPSSLTDQQQAAGVAQEAPSQEWYEPVQQDPQDDYWQQSPHTVNGAFEPVSQPLPHQPLPHQPLPHQPLVAPEVVAAPIWTAPVLPESPVISAPVTSRPATSAPATSAPDPVAPISVPVVPPVVASAPVSESSAPVSVIPPIPAAPAPTSNAAVPAPTSNAAMSDVAMSDVAMSNAATSDAAMSDVAMSDVAEAEASSALSGGAEDDDESEETVIVRRPAKPSWTLTSSAGESIDLVEGDFILGRKPVRTATFIDAEPLAVADPQKTVSKVHAHFIWRADRQSWTIEDLNSTNGVFVGEELVELSPETPTPVSGIFYLGELKLTLASIAK